MRILVGEIHGLATYAAYSLGLKYLKAGSLESTPGACLSV